MAHRVFMHGGTTFRWDATKAERNLRKHGVLFEEAVTVFDDPFFILLEASRSEEHRGAVIGFSSNGRLLTVVHIEADDEHIRIISARHASNAEEAIYAE